MNLVFAQPWLLLTGLLAVLPWLASGQRALRYSSIAMLPEDRVSDWLDRGLRLTAMAALLALALGLAGPYRREQWVERVGSGAHIVLVVDHSSSMNDNFSGVYLGGKTGESKSALASRLLEQFIDSRREDLFGVVAFSAAPIAVLPLTQDREALRAAVRALGRRGHGVTHIAPGLLMALDYFHGRPVTGSRALLLVSDGAARLDEDTRDTLRQAFLDQHAGLYWIYLRNPRGSRLDTPPANPNESTTPEYFLHQYFQSLGVPYRAYEAENPQAVQDAIADLARLENQPLIYREKQPRQDLAGYYWASALGLSLILLIFRALEVRSWRS